MRQLQIRSRRVYQHFIRDVVLQKIVLEAVGELADFVRCYEPVFLYLIARNSAKGRKQEMKDLKIEIEAGRRRIEELDRLISRIYEDNVLGRLSDERYERMSAGYEKEQHDLVTSVAENERRLREMEKERMTSTPCSRAFVSSLRCGS